MNWYYLPPWSARGLALVALLIFVTLALRAWRERRFKSFFLRALALSLLLWVALNPTRFVLRADATKPKLIVLVDTSASMATRDAGDASRLEAAAKTLANSRDAFQNFVVDVRRFDRDVRSVDLSALSATPANGEATDIGAVLSASVNEQAESKGQAGVLLVSDGRATTEGAVNAGRLALARGVPLWTWCLGGSVPRRDLWIETPASEVLSFAKAEVELSATVKQAGYPDRSFKVELLKDDQVLESRTVVPAGDGGVRVAMKVTAPAAGEHRYVFRVPPESDEADTGNNERAIFLRVVGDKARVLVVEGQPHWDTKFLVQALKADPHVELTAVYRLSAARHVAIVSAQGHELRSDTNLFPHTAAAMNQFDVIILGRGAETFFNEQTESLLTGFVATRGGSLVFARGKPYEGRFPALSKLEPVVWGEGVESGVRLKSSDEHAAFDLGGANADEMPALDQASVTLGEKPLASIMAANGPNAILLAQQRYGQGRVVTLNAAGLWRWAFGSGAQAKVNTEQVYQRFWLSALRWLLAGDDFLPGADVALTSARRSYTSDQPMQFLIRTREADAASGTGVGTNYQPRLTITGAGQMVEVLPQTRSGGGLSAEAGPFPPGTYLVTLTNNVGRPAALTLKVDVVSASVEKRDLNADATLMKQLAEWSGGRTLAASDVAQFDKVYQHWQSTRPSARREAALWDHWWVLLIVVGLLGTEWWVRRQEGLV